MYGRDQLARSDMCGRDQLARSDIMCGRDQLVRSDSFQLFACAEVGHPKALRCVHHLQHPIDIVCGALHV